MVQGLQDRNPSSNAEQPGTNKELASATGEGNAPSALESEKARVETTESELVPFDESNMYGWSNAQHTSGANAQRQKSVKTVLAEQNDILSDIAYELKQVTSHLDTNTKTIKELKGIVEKEEKDQTKLVEKIVSEVKSMKTLLIAANVMTKKSKGSEAGEDSAATKDEIVDLLKAINEVEHEANEAERVKNMDPMDRLIMASKKSEEEKRAESEKSTAEKQKAAAATDQSEEDIGSEKTKEEKLAAMEQALQQLFATNTDKENLLLGLSTMGLYLSNLLTNWDNKIYGKISLSNQTYKKNLKEIGHHIEFLKACGFKLQQASTYSSNKKEFLEFSKEWRENRANWSEDVLKKAKELLETSQEDVRKGTIILGTPQAETVEAKVGVEITKSVGEDSGETQAEHYPSSFLEVSELLAKDANWKPPDAKDIPNSLSQDRDKYLKDVVPASVTVPQEQGTGNMSKPWELNPDNVPTTERSSDEIDAENSEGAAVEHKLPANDTTVEDVPEVN